MSRSMIRRARRRYLTMADAPLVADLAADLVARRFAEAIKSSFKFGHRGAERHEGPVDHLLGEDVETNLHAVDQLGGDGEAAAELRSAFVDDRPVAERDSHDDSSVPRGPESPDGTTVEDLQRRGGDSRPDADEVDAKLGGTVA